MLGIARINARRKEKKERQGVKENIDFLIYLVLIGSAAGNKICSRNEKWLFFDPVATVPSRCAYYEACHKRSLCVIDNSGARGGVIEHCIC